MAENNAIRARKVLHGRHGLSGTQLDDIIATLVDSALLAAPIDGLKAAATAHGDRLFDEACRTARRYRIEPDPISGLINAAECDRQLAGLPVTTRLGLKSLFNKAGLLA